MKIAFIVDTFPCLSETFILNQVTGLLGRGHQVDIYATRDKRLAERDVLHPDVVQHRLAERTYYLAVPPGKIRRVLSGARLIATHILRHPLVALGIALRTCNVFKYGMEAL
jgi:colanic acid/amylovoran biosynthesis glycosyltransferase